MFNCYSTRIDIRRQNLRSVDVNEEERADWEIYNDFKLKKLFGLHGFYTNISAL